MSSEHLPIFKAALDLCVYIDVIVKSQERYYKYTISSEMRSEAKEILLLIAKANSYNLYNKVGRINETNPFAYS